MSMKGIIDVVMFQYVRCYQQREKPKKFQGYDGVVYKQIKRFIAQNVVAMDPWLKAYVEKKQVV